MMSGQVNDYALVKLVESFPILYDKDLARGQKNATLKDKAWKELSLRLNASERACITRWKSIRDRFGKEYRRVQENPDEPTNWDIFPHLLFLKEHYKHGNANNICVENVKYEPRLRKRKLRVDNTSQGEDESNNEDDMDADDLMVNQQLIALVREHPVIYDKQKIRDSKNLTAKNESWREISESLGISEEVCYKRWKKLRDRFAREYRHQKLNPDTPVMWTYFQDLMFLEGHYRKGIPLNVEIMKRKPIAINISHSSSNAIVDPWGNDFPYDCQDEDQEQPMPDSEGQYSDIQSHTLDELLIMPSKKELLPTTQHQQYTDETFLQRKESFSSINNPMLTTTSVISTEPELKLTSVISNIEHVLRQSHDCLQSLHEQNQRHKEELQSNLISSQPQMLQKVHLLLDGLSAEHRNRAERKILHFLCECQIKSLNNEDIDDVGIEQFY